MNKITYDNTAGINNQHKQLGEMVDMVCETLKNGHALDDVKGILDKLQGLTKTHFIEEEKLMRLYRYEKLESHINMHQVLLNKLTKLNKNTLSDFNQENKTDLLAFLKTDFKGHIVSDTEAWEKGEIANECVHRRLEKYAVPMGDRVNDASEHSTYNDATMTHRGLPKSSMP